MDPLEDSKRANEITRRILTHQNVSEAEYRYIVMFNLAAMTQLLWELGEREGRSQDRPRTISTLTPERKMDTNARAPKSRRRLALVASAAAFLAGLGVGYLLP